MLMMPFKMALKFNSTVALWDKGNQDRGATSLALGFEARAELKASKSLIYKNAKGAFQFSWEESSGKSQIRDGLHKLWHSKLNLS